MKLHPRELRGWSQTVAKILATGMAVLLPAVVQAQFTFTTNNGTITITGYAGSGGTAVIPSTTNGYTVTGIGEFAFEDCTTITSIVIPNSITNIGEGPFLACTSVTNISMSAGNSWFSSLNGVLFDSGQETLIAYPPGRTNGTYILPFLTSIGEYAFASCSSLTNMYIDLNNVGAFAFLECTGLTSVTVTNPLNGVGDIAPINIGENAFFGCAGLTNVLMANTVTNIGDWAFGECTSLTNVIIPSRLIDVGSFAFALCDKLRFIYFQSNAPSNDGTAFYGDPDAGVYYLPGAIGWGTTFGGAPTMEESTPASDFYYDTFDGSVNILGYNNNDPSVVVIPSTINGYPVTSIESQAFQDARVTRVTIPGSVTSFEGAFSTCLDLTTVSIDNGVINIGQDAFLGCGNLTSVTIPNSVTSIGERAFVGSGLTTVTIPGSVTNIGDSAFGACNNLTNITIPNSIISIGASAFGGCTSLTNIVIPRGVTSIGSDIFESCTNLTSAYFEGDAPPDLGNAFQGDPATVYYLPGTTGWGATFGGVPTALWYQPQPTILSFEPSFGMKNQQFGFPISWATNASVMVQACTNLTNPVWVSVATNVLSNGTNYFSDTQWTNYPSRFYRVSGQ
jgi:BspA type Leucine rich repeat region (6 copies)